MQRSRYRSVDVELRNHLLLYSKWVINKDLLYIAQGTLLTVMWQAGWDFGGE